MNKSDKYVVVDNIGDQQEIVNSESEARKIAAFWAKADFDEELNSDIVIAKVILRVTYEPPTTPKPKIKFIPVK